MSGDGCRRSRELEVDNDADEQLGEESRLVLRGITELIFAGKLYLAESQDGSIRVGGRCRYETWAARDGQYDPEMYGSMNREIDLNGGCTAAREPPDDEP